MGTPDLSLAIAKDPGPLLWHFENSPDSSSKTGDGSIELSLDEVRLLAEKIGFVIEVRRARAMSRRADSKGRAHDPDYIHCYPRKYAPARIQRELTTTRTR